MVNAQHGRPIFLLSCEIRLPHSKFFCYGKHKNLLTVKQRYEIGPMCVVLFFRELSCFIFYFRGVDFSGVFSVLKRTVLLFYYYMYLGGR